MWFEPKEVWEVRGAELTISPVHLAACAEVGGGKGLGLRFPRFVRVRDDKGVEDATTCGEVMEMFRKQVRRKGV